ncbi:MAG: response regulator [Pseudobdellovibrionaceae bacterium]
MSDAKFLLLVEDETDLADILKDEFESLGYEVAHAENGKKALDYYQEVKDGKRRIDAILSDFDMPKMNGIMMLKEIRKLGYQTPLVFLSGYGSVEKVNQAKSAGAMEFLNKPYNRALLIETMEKAVEVGQKLK